MGYHFMTWATNSTAVCGADMVGQRNSRRDTDPAQTTCEACKRSEDWYDEACAKGLYGAAGDDSIAAPDDLDTTPRSEDDAEMAARLIVLSWN